MLEAVRLSAFYRLVALECVDSTSEEARRLAAAGAAEGTLVWAHEQTAGRGRRGRPWVSGPGNLYCSLLLRPTWPAHEAMQMGFVTGVAVADAIAAALPRHAQVACKWPNDVLVEGRKVTGVLLESEASADGGLDWLAIGVGINIAHHPGDDVAAYPATSLHAEGGEGVTVDAMLQSYCNRLQSWMVTWRRLGFAAVRQAWLRRAFGLGRRITVRLENETLAGTFVTLDDAGALVLGGDEGERRITAGEVFPATAVGTAAPAH